MGKHGPCYHCGVTSTPLWRNGPPEKPVLCNACGSRWRTKGTLANYTPLHARPEHDEIETQFSNLRTMSAKTKDARVLKRKLTHDFGEIGIHHLENSLGVQRVFDEDTSNRSSSGSAISNNDSCVQYGSADASEFTGPSQPPSMWDSTVPSRKRTCFARPKQSPVEKLTKDLYTIWHQQQSSCISGSSEEELLLESGKPMVSVEIGHGSVLIRHPSSITKEEESEASSLSFDTKQFNKSASKGAVLRIPRDSDQKDKFQFLSSHGSPLRLIDLQDIVNYESFSSQLTGDEQQKLLKFLPTVDTTGSLDSLETMFASCQFKENLFSFQKLLDNGVFDGSVSGVLPADCRNLQKLIFCDMRKSQLVKKYTDLKDFKGKKNMKVEVAAGFNVIENVSPVSMTRARDGPHKKLAGPNIKAPRMSVKTEPEDAKIKDRHGSSACTKGLFLLQKEEICSISNFIDEDKDLLVHVPSNSYPEAELLVPASGIASSSSSSVYQACFLGPR